MIDSYFIGPSHLPSPHRLKVPTKNTFMTLFTFGTILLIKYQKSFKTYEVKKQREGASKHKVKHYQSLFQIYTQSLLLYILQHYRNVVLWFLFFTTMVMLCTAQLLTLDFMYRCGAKAITNWYLRVKYKNRSMQGPKLSCSKYQFLFSFTQEGLANAVL